MRFSRTTVSVLAFVCGGFVAIPPVAAQTITEIIDATGDGAGNGLNGPIGIAVDTAGNVYVPGIISDNAFQITPAGVITEIIDCLSECRILAAEMAREVNSGDYCIKYG